MRRQLHPVDGEWMEYIQPTPPSPSRGADSSIRCFRCLGRGHMAHSCSGPLRCRRCKKEGHRWSECTAPRNRRPTGRQHTQATSASTATLLPPSRNRQRQSPTMPEPAEAQTVTFAWTPALQQSVEFLRNCVVGELSGPPLDHAQLRTSLIAAMGAATPFHLSRIAPREWLLIPSSEQQRLLLLSAPTPLSQRTTVTWRSWSEMDGTVAPPPATRRNVRISGIPVHLMHPEVVTTVIGEFGTPLVLAIPTAGSPDLSIVSAEVEMRPGCHMPSAMMLEVQTGRFLLRLQSPPAGGGSWADVVAGNCGVGQMSSTAYVQGHSPASGAVEGEANTTPGTASLWADVAIAGNTYQGVQQAGGTSNVQEGVSANGAGVHDMLKAAVNLPIPPSPFHNPFSTHIDRLKTAVNLPIPPSPCHNPFSTHVDPSFTQRPNNYPSTNTASPTLPISPTEPDPYNHRTTKEPYLTTTPISLSPTAEPQTQHSTRTAPDSSSNPTSPAPEVLVQTQTTPTPDHSIGLNRAQSAPNLLNLSRRTQPHLTGAPHLPPPPTNLQPIKLAGPTPASPHEPNPPSPPAPTAGFRPLFFCHQQYRRRPHAAASSLPTAPAYLLPPPSNHTTSSCGKVVAASVEATSSGIDQGAHSVNTHPPSSPLPLLPPPPSSTPTPGVAENETDASPDGPSTDAATPAPLLQGRSDTEVLVVAAAAEFQGSQNLDCPASSSLEAPATQPSPTPLMFSPQPPASGAHHQRRRRRTDQPDAIRQLGSPGLSELLSGYLDEEVAAVAAAAGFRLQCSRGLGDRSSSRMRTRSMSSGVEIISQ